uniref:Methyltransferase FkbM domain-containing protein n=1 Tax=Thermosporothrix sp. COM3 TaxID=2490863 RepID=A0A455SXI9_9CHLR|nr:hypothetical protein KTC_63630 [Thermosporothrix sp. COM3]
MQEKYVLPNGMTVAKTNEDQLKQLYAEIFEERQYLAYGITLEENAIVLDVGANIGLFTLFCHSVCPSAKIYAFEPIAETFQTLRTNVALNNIDARLFQMGLADRAGEEEFTVFALYNSNSTRVPDLEETRSIMRNKFLANVPDAKKSQMTEEEIQKVVHFFFTRHTTQLCKVETLSRVLREQALEHVDLLKIDAEKSEYDILQGIDAQDWPKIRQIVMEVHGDYLLEKVLPLLQQQGYQTVVGDNKRGLGNAENGRPITLSHVYAWR